MGKKQHSKDRLFITRSEWIKEWGGYKETRAVKLLELPFYCCSLSLQPFTHPYSTHDGYIFDLTTIFPYIKQFKKHPITDEPLTTKDIIKLNFYKNDDQEYHCPITCKIFTKYTHIVAIKTTGNVYAYNAVKQLNILKNNYKDLMNSKPFDPKTDIITIQDPNKPKNRAIKRKDVNKNEPPKKKRKLNQDKKDEKKEDKLEDVPLKLEMKEYKDGSELGLYNEYTTGNMAASFTSTLMTRVVTDKHVPYTAEQVRQEIWRNVKGKGKKGLIRMVTNIGNLNFELHCDYVPKTCYNFMLHCVKGTYNNTIFHRNIPSFMIQGGDPKGTGYGGSCAWTTKSGKFEDEFHKYLKHDIRGTLSMANSGPNTNGSQFFIIYDECKHLDNKHSVFGKLVGGKDVLTKMERIKTGNNDKPLSDIILKKVIIYTNPFTDLLPHQLKIKKETESKNIERMNKIKGKWWSGNSIFNDNNDGSDDIIGKYIDKSRLNTNNNDNNNGNIFGKQLRLPLPKTKKNTGGFDTKLNVFRFKHFKSKQ